MTYYADDFQSLEYDLINVAEAMDGSYIDNKCKEMGVRKGNIFLNQKRKLDESELKKYPLDAPYSKDKPMDFNKLMTEEMDMDK